MQAVENKPQFQSDRSISVTNSAENATALFEPGLHVVSRTQLRERCVDPFVQSTTRLDLTIRLFQLLDWIESFGVKSEAWVDGSYTTSKVDPRDVDLVIFIDRGDIELLTNSAYAEFLQIQDRALIKARYNCDVYVDPLGDSDRSKYWRFKFGSDNRTNLSKGIAVIKLDGSTH